MNTDLNRANTQRRKGTGICLALLLWSAWAMAQSTVVFNVPQIGNIATNVGITCWLQSEGQFSGPDIITGAPIRIQLTNGTAAVQLTNLLVWNVSIDGVDKVFRMPVPNGTNTWNAVDLINRGASMDAPYPAIAQGTNGISIVTNWIAGLPIITVSFTGNTNGGSGSGGPLSLSGDATGTTAASVVSLVGGQTASSVASATAAANAATSANTASTIVKRDGSGNFSAGTITATLFGAASTAASFTNPLSGDVTGNQGVTVVSHLGAISGANLTSLNASAISSGVIPPANLPIATSTAVGAIKPDNTTTEVDGLGRLSAIGGLPSGAAAGDLTNNYPNPGVATVGGVTAANVASGANAANAATSANTPITIISRDSSGNFSAGSATLATGLTVSAGGANISGNSSVSGGLNVNHQLAIAPIVNNTALLLAQSPNAVLDIVQGYSNDLSTIIFRMTSNGNLLLPSVTASNGFIGNLAGMATGAAGFVSAESLGLAGNGTTDDRAALQTEINSNSGRTIVLDKPTYNLGGTVFLTNNTHIISFCGSTLLFATNATGAEMLATTNCTNIMLLGFKLDGQYALFHGGGDFANSDCRICGPNGWGSHAWDYLNGVNTLTNQVAQNVFGLRTGLQICAQQTNSYLINLVSQNFSDSGFMFVGGQATFPQPRYSTLHCLNLDSENNWIAYNATNGSEYFVLDNCQAHANGMVFGMFSGNVQVNGGDFERNCVVVRASGANSISNPAHGHFSNCNFNHCDIPYYLDNFFQGEMAYNCSCIGQGGGNTCLVQMTNCSGVVITGRADFTGITCDGGAGGDSGKNTVEVTTQEGIGTIVQISNGGLLNFIPHIFGQGDSAGRNMTNSFEAWTFLQTLTGTFAGNGAAITALNASAIASGTVPESHSTTNFAGPLGAATLTGAFIGNAGQLTNLMQSAWTNMSATANSTNYQPNLSGAPNVCIAASANDVWISALTNGPGTCYLRILPTGANRNFLFPTNFHTFGPTNNLISALKGTNWLIVMTNGLEFDASVGPATAAINPNAANCSIKFNVSAN